MEHETMERLTYGEALGGALQSKVLWVVLVTTFFVVGIVFSDPGLGILIAAGLFIFRVIALGSYYLECRCEEITSPRKKYCPNCKRKTPERYYRTWHRGNFGDDDDHEGQ